ncbi:MAG TPA: transposase [Streptosporangiaceae bacterium]|nr:transposase [Streptosporangiaceae bacterium]
MAVAADVVPDTESAGARSGDGLAAALEENARLRAENAELRVALAQVLARDAERDAELDKLRADLAVLQPMLFGRSSERSRPDPPAGAGGAAGGQGAGTGTGRKRGPGARAGRRDYSHLPRFGVFWDFPGGGYCCPDCGEPFTLLGDQAGALLAPVAEAITQRSRGSWHLHADETTWRVFAPRDGSGPAKWWLWVFTGPDTVCLVMDPTRSGAVLARHAGIDGETGQLTADEDGGPRRLVISSDFYAVYQSAGKKADGMVDLYCWAHIRRYFVRARDADPARLTYRTQAWPDRIKALYAAHDELTAAWDGAAAPAPQDKTAAARLGDAYAAWDEAIGAIGQTRKKQMTAPGLQEPARKALATLDREWDGLTAHRDYPMIGLDNNAAERMIRGPVVTRKNAGGSRNGDTARNAAVIRTVTATAQMAGLNLLTWLTAYLDECGRNGGKPLMGVTGSLRAGLTGSCGRLGSGSRRLVSTPLPPGLEPCGETVPPLVAGRIDR